MHRLDTRRRTEARQLRQGSAARSLPSPWRRVLSGRHTSNLADAQAHLCAGAPPACALPAGQGCAWPTNGNATVTLDKVPPPATARSCITPRQQIGHCHPAASAPSAYMSLSRSATMVMVAALASTLLACNGRVDPAARFLILERAFGVRRSLTPLLARVDAARPPAPENCRSPRRRPPRRTAPAHRGRSPFRSSPRPRCRDRTWLAKLISGSYPAIASTGRSATAKTRLLRCRPSTQGSTVTSSLANEAMEPDFSRPLARVQPPSGRHFGVATMQSSCIRPFYQAAIPDEWPE